MSTKCWTCCKTTCKRGIPGSMYHIQYIYTFLCQNDLYSLWFLNNGWGFTVQEAAALTEELQTQFQFWYRGSSQTQLQKTTVLVIWIYYYCFALQHCTLRPPQRSWIPRSKAWRLSEHIGKECHWDKKLSEERRWITEGKRITQFNKCRPEVQADSSFPTGSTQRLIVSQVSVQ